MIVIRKIEVTNDINKNRKSWIKREPAPSNRVAWEYL